MPSRHAISPDGLRLLRECFELPGSEPGAERDSSHVVFLSIDFDSHFVSQGSGIPIQLGISILDTLHLTSSTSPDREDIISTYYFAAGPSRYYTSAAAKFLFGETIQISHSDIISKIESLIPRTRPTVLVGHDITNDLQVLQHLKVDLLTSIIGILDTMTITPQIFPSKSGCSLRAILEEVQCPYNNLHSAGNDAHFTLRCLLLLVSKSYANVALEPAYQEKLEILEGIAYSEIPEKVKKADQGQIRAAKKRLKRVGRSRKHQAKTWDTETQEQIRAERAAKKKQIGDRRHNQV